MKVIQRRQKADAFRITDVVRSTTHLGEVTTLRMENGGQASATPGMIGSSAKVGDYYVTPEGGTPVVMTEYAYKLAYEPEPDPVEIPEETCGPECEQDSEEQVDDAQP